MPGVECTGIIVYNNTCTFVSCFFSFKTVVKKVPLVTHEGSDTNSQPKWMIKFICTTEVFETHTQSLYNLNSQFSFVRIVLIAVLNLALSRGHKYCNKVYVEFKLHR